MFNNQQHNYKNITTVSSPIIFAGPGTLARVLINDINSKGTITLTDTASPSATIGTINLANSPWMQWDYFVAVAGGLQVTTSASPNITVTWTK